MHHFLLTKQLLLTYTTKYKTYRNPILLCCRQCEPRNSGYSVLSHQGDGRRLPLKLRRTILNIADVGPGGRTDWSDRGGMSKVPIGLTVVTTVGR